jgi:hypothetical protein
MFRPITDECIVWAVRDEGVGKWPAQVFLSETKSEDDDADPLITLAFIPKRK